MPNHPNRGAPNSASNPTPAELVEFRRIHALTAAQAGALVYVSANGWLQWESGARRCHPAFWELANLKVVPGFEPP